MDQTIPPPLARPALAFVLALACLPALATPRDTDTALAACRKEKSSRDRLACYDRIGIQQPDTRSWKGRNSTETLSLATQARSTLRVEHADAILVATLKDAAGNTLENLHLAGPGTLEITLPAAGSYQVTLSATGAWTARLVEP